MQRIKLIGQSDKSEGEDSQGEGHEEETVTEVNPGLNEFPDSSYNLQTVCIISDVQVNLCERGSCFHQWIRLHEDIFQKCETNNPGYMFQSIRSFIRKKRQTSCYCQNMWSTLINDNLITTEIR